MSNTEDFEKKYPASFVVMQNKILQAFFDMSLSEKRILLLASPIARMIDATEKDAIKIAAHDFAIDCDVKVDSAYSLLEEASRAMMKRQFSYKNERGKRVNVQWVIRSIYEEGAISVCFTDEVLFMLKVFNGDNPFTKYKKEFVLKLKRDYSIDFYHIFKKHEAMTTFIMTLDEIKTEFNLPKAYDRISNLKSRVIKPTLEEINKETDINVTFENVKKGRTVVGLKFTVRAKPKPKAVAVSDLEQDIKELTEKQIDMFVNKFTSDASFNSKAPTGMKMQDFKAQIKAELRTEKGRKKYRAKLLENGYEFPKRQ